MNEIMGNITDTVDVTNVIKPFFNFKSAELMTCAFRNVCCFVLMHVLTAQDKIKNCLDELGKTSRSF